MYRKLYFSGCSQESFTDPREGNYKEAFETDIINEGFLITFVVFYYLPPGCRLLFFLGAETDKPCRPYRHHRARTSFHTIVSRPSVPYPRTRVFADIAAIESTEGTASRRTGVGACVNPHIDPTWKTVRIQKIINNQSTRVERILLVSILSPAIFDNVNCYAYILYYYYL